MCVGGGRGDFLGILFIDGQGERLPHGGVVVLFMACCHSEVSCHVVRSDDKGRNDFFHRVYGVPAESTYRVGYAEVVKICNLLDATPALDVIVLITRAIGFVEQHRSLTVIERSPAD